MSQEALAEKSSLATRHISRLESDETQPRRDTVMQLGSALALRKRDLNALLIASGHSPEQSDAELGSPRFDGNREALRRFVLAQEPHPTLVAAPNGSILLSNAAWESLVNRLAMEGRWPLGDLDLGNFFEWLFQCSDSGLLDGGGEELISKTLLALTNLAAVEPDSAAASTRDRLLRFKSVPSDWQAVGGSAEPGVPFAVRLSLDGRPERLVAHTHSYFFSGVFKMVPRPDLAIVFFYPEDESVDVARLIGATKS